MAQNNDTDKGKKIPSVLDKITLLPSDRVLGIIIAILFVISLIVVYSSSAQVAYRHNISPDVYLKRHILTLIGTAATMLIAYFVPVKVVRTFTPLVYVLSLGMTVAAYFIGDGGDDALRTLVLPGGLKFQPSEVLKIATIMVLVKQLSKFHTNISKVHLLPTTFKVKQWWKDLTQRNIILQEMLPIVLPIALSCAAILPAHTSSALLLFIVSMIVLYIAGIKKREIGKILIAAVLVGSPIILVGARSDTVEGRVGRFFKSSDVDETKRGMDKYRDSFRSRMAIHNGGLFGVGAGHSVMRGRLVHPESDYLFAIVVEELGSIIAFILILLYLWIFFRAIRIFDGSQWLYAGLLAVGLALLIVVHAFLHIGVALGCIPETGQNLPFLTQGRTSMWMTGAMVGVILGISRQIKMGTLVPPGQKSDARTKL